MSVSTIKNFDYIIDEGTETVQNKEENGDDRDYSTTTWYYRIWKNGKIEAWASFPWTINAWPKWNNTWYSTPYSPVIPYPSVFSGYPSYVVSGQLSSGDAWIVDRGITVNSLRGIPPHYFIRPVNGTTGIAATINIYVCNK